METRCQNPDEACDRVASYDHHGMRLCRRCFKRFTRHGDGKKLEPWDAAKRKKNAPTI